MLSLHAFPWDFDPTLTYPPPAYPFPSSTIQPFHPTSNLPQFPPLQQGVRIHPSSFPSFSQFPRLHQDLQLPTFYPVQDSDANFSVSRPLPHSNPSPRTSGCSHTNKGDLRRSDFPDSSRFVCSTPVDFADSGLVDSTSSFQQESGGRNVNDFIHTPADVHRVWTPLSQLCSGANAQNCETKFHAGTRIHLGAQRCSDVQEAESQTVKCRSYLHTPYPLALRLKALSQRFDEDDIKFGADFSSEFTSQPRTDADIVPIFNCPVSDEIVV
jgi:hypothetical protein